MAKTTVVVESIEGFIKALESGSRWTSKGGRTYIDANRSADGEDNIELTLKDGRRFWVKCEAVPAVKREAQATAPKTRKAGKATEASAPAAVPADPMAMMQAMMAMMQQAMAAKAAK